VDKLGRKVVLWKDPKDTKEALEADDRPELQCFTTNRDKKHPRPIPKLVLKDVEKLWPVLQKS
jgi:hypothetical protein